LKNKMYMAINQYGNTFHGLKNPRKDLMEKIGVKHASKMYVDDLTGKTFHIGYIIGGHWLTVYEVVPTQKVA